MRVRDLVLFCSVFIIVNAGRPKENFDADYYFSSSLRSTETCDHLSKMYCQLECNNKNGVCIDGKCYCFSIREANAERSSITHNYENSQESLQYALRPTVRHHIAHFCPNLEIARTCIRKCMVEGKPAFCGKDHVCYCGHKYKNTDINHKIDAQNVYNQFKDLYTKYFGPNVNGNKGHGEKIDAIEI